MLPSVAPCGPQKNFSVLPILKFVAPRVEFSDLLGGPGSCGEGSRTISPAEAKFLSVGFTGCGKSALVVILSEAKNPSRFKTNDEEGFFAQNRRSE